MVLKGELSKLIHQGIFQAAKEGKVLGGRIFGYDLGKRVEGNYIVRGERSINEEEAEIVRWIFSSFLDGADIASICNELKNSSSPAASRRKWKNSLLVHSHDSKTGMLFQTLYKGVYTFNKFEQRIYYKTRKKKAFLRPRSEWIEVEIPHLKIVEPELFDAVQVKLEQNRRILPKRRRKPSPKLK